MTRRSHGRKHPEKEPTVMTPKPSEPALRLETLEGSIGLITFDQPNSRFRHGFDRGT